MFPEQAVFRWKSHILKLITFTFLKKTAHQNMLFYTCDSIPATLFTVATIPGTAIGGVIADKWGKKVTMCTSNILAYVFWLITTFANNKYLLFLSYSFQGFFGIIGLNLVGKHKYINIVENFPCATNHYRNLYS